MNAIENANLQLAEMVLEDKKFDPNYYANEAGTTPILFAIAKGR